MEIMYFKVEIFAAVKVCIVYSEVAQRWLPLILTNVLLHI